MTQDSPLCPVCGFAVTGSRPSDRRAIRAEADEPSEGSPGLLWYAALVLIASALLAGIVSLGLLGAEHGLNTHRQRAAELGQAYYERGLAHLEEGNYLLALAEFEEAVRLSPDNPEAREQLGLLQALMGTEDTSSTAPSADVLLSLLGEASAEYAQGGWTGTITRLEELRRLDPRYRSQEVEDMLFDAYREQSAVLLEAGELEEAMTLLEGALELRPDDPDAAELHYWISLYLAGLSQSGVNWERAAITFRQLYALNPSFLDVGPRFHDALLKAGDLFYDEGAWCVAESQYAEALRVMATDTATAKRDEARDLCVQAILEASPTAVSSSLSPEAGSPTATAERAATPAGFVGAFVGYADADATEMRVSVCVLSARGEEVPGAEVQISAPGWRAEPKATEVDGCCEFAGLTEQLELTVELVGLPNDPVLIVTRWGTEAQVSFFER